MSNLGQALLEYLLLIVFGVIVASNLVKTLSESTGNKIGNLTHYLSESLTTGVCERECFFSGYKNGRK